MNLLKSEIRAKGLYEYFRVVLLDDESIDIVKTIGRFETLEEAKAEACRYCGDDLVLVSRVRIYRYYYNGLHLKYKFDANFETTF